jgi:hypothetical protein
MAKREEQRRKRQAQDNRTNQMWRGVDMFAPAGVEGDYIDVYPLVSRRGRIIKGTEGGMSREVHEKLFGTINV